MNAEKVILDLCGGTGAWSDPYREAGYDVRLVTLPVDVRLVEWPGQVHGILAAPPCTVFSNAGAWVKRTEDELRDGLSVVDACLRLVAVCGPAWWALENPVGKLKRWLGPWRMSFNPCDYGDPWTKRTCLWGRFNPPAKNPVQPVGSIIDRAGCKSSTAKVNRAITPPGFAQAFFEANP